jgi:hypothetical protein
VAAGPRSALGVAGVVSRGGLVELQRQLGISPRQAEELAAKCRRALLRGEEIDPATFPRGTVVGAQNRAQAAPEPAEVDLDADAQAEARRIRALLPSDRQRRLVELSAREATMVRNIENGHREWAGELAQLRRIRQLVGVV